MKKRKTLYIHWFLFQIISLKRIVITAVILTVLCCLKCLSTSINMPYDSIIYGFWGYGNGGFSVSEFIGTLIVNGIPVYYIAIFLSEERQSKSSYIIIRMKKLRNWFWQFQIAVSVVILMYLGLYVILNGLFPKLIGLNGDGSVIRELYHIIGADIEYPALEIFISALLRYLEIMVWQMVLVCTFSLRKNIMAAFISLLTLNIFNIIALPWWYPIGISSIQRYRLSANLTEDALVVGGILFLAYVTGCIYMKQKGLKKLFD